jgi:hypothetical protein
MTPFRCGLDPKNIKMFTTAVVSCILAKLVVYFMATKSNNRHITVDKEIELTDVRSRKPGEQNQKTLSESPLQRPQNPPKMQLNATMTLVANLIPMILVVSLSRLHLLGRLICKQFFDDCEMLKHLGVFYQELVLLHVSTDLLVYIFRSLEFRSAVRSLFMGSILCSPIEVI